MTDFNPQAEQALYFLQERAKELGCLYKVEELLENPDRPLDEVFAGAVEAIPPGWQYPKICSAQIIHQDTTHKSTGFQESPWAMREEIRVQGEPVGNVTVYYSKEMPDAAEGPFLAEERRLIRTIADRLGHFILHQDLRRAFHQCQSAHEPPEPEWRVALNLLRNTDIRIYETIARKLLHHLCWLGIKEARDLFQSANAEERLAATSAPDSEPNTPLTFRTAGAVHSPEKIFEVASRHVSNEDMLSTIQRWIHEDKSSFLLKTLIDEHSSLSQIADAMARYQRLLPEGLTLTKSATKNVVVALIRRFFTGHLDFIANAKAALQPEDFFSLLENVVYTPGSHGKLGGKSAGLFLAYHILRRNNSKDTHLGEIRIPKTWHLASDGLLEFIRHNNLEEVLDQKYKEIDQVRQEYDYIVRVFKGSRFTPEILKGLSVALDDFGDTPLIVRSSSLLEDGSGTSFPGKYKSLFLANTGTKQQRLEALLDAIAEVYASTFGPDPIEYRSSRGLIDFDEQMGVMIQEVVGKRIGKYYLPLCAGVAFSKNELRWSPRIERDDGIVRLVPGLGTRAVDRIHDDYPVLLSPGKPTTRANTSPEEIARYSPRMIDLINLESGRFETLDIKVFLRENAEFIPRLKWLVSVFEDGNLREPVGAPFAISDKNLVVTFDGLVRRTPFMRQIKNAIDTLEEKLGTPVDVEFAWDGDRFYLLQCRPQSSSRHSTPSPIPSDVSRERIIFTAERHISNSRIPELSHIVFIDPEAYSRMNDRADLESVGRAVGKLNRLLPKRRFALMGPGRWGSRGDIKLGVNVSYSDINNTALLVEIAKQQGSYIPELSFGTHFFQDLVESEITYLPLYPDDEGTQFNWMFFRSSPNLLGDLLPEHSNLEEAIRVIDVRNETEGKILKVLTNGELSRALGLLSPPEASTLESSFIEKTADPEEPDHWQWRLRMAEKLADKMAMLSYGVKAIYIFGSTKNASAKAESDIDLLLHVEDDPSLKRESLSSWLDGWSSCLTELNYMRTGYRVDNILDIHFVTDDHIARKTSFACKIGAITDSARLLRKR